MPALNISAADQAAVLIGVSHKYNIPIKALAAIYGQETSFGQNVTTSSTGAQGPFQFEPATAAQYGYPLTNTPTLSQFEQQANAWGKYLVANNPSRSPTGWAPAMGGGYTESQAESTLANIPAALRTAIGQEAGYLSINNSGALSGTGLNVQGAGGVAGTIDSTIGGAASTVGSAVSSAADVGTVLSDVWNAVTNPSNWLRALKIVGGAIAVFFAIKGLTGMGTPTIRLQEAKH